MRIVLVRHGKPEAVSRASISGQAIGQWVRRYNDVGITRELPPPAAVRELASSSRCVVASDLLRARESAAWLAPSKDVRIDSELREAALPESLGVATRLAPAAWLNWCKSDETIAMTRQRTHRVADRLGALASQYGSIMVVGHGMFNWFVAHELRRRGWRGPKVLPRAYWAAAQFERPTGPI
jgi:broad specificity phosphatase PhoE